MKHENENTLPCSDKVVFQDKKTADGAAATALWQHGTKLKSYECRHCGLWHLASSFDE